LVVCWGACRRSSFGVIAANAAGTNGFHATGRTNRASALSAKVRIGINHAKKPSRNGRNKSDNTNMSIRHNFTIVCEKMIISNVGEFSAINMFSNVRLKTVPGSLAKMFILVGLSGELGDEYSLEIVRPREKNGEQLLKGVVKQEDKKYTSKFSNINIVAFAYYEPMVFVQEGIYRIELRQGKKLIHRLPFGVFREESEKP
jgi:hypothetical protein